MVLLSLELNLSCLNFSFDISLLLFYLCDFVLFGFHLEFNCILFLGFGSKLGRYLL